MKNAQVIRKYFNEVAERESVTFNLFLMSWLKQCQMYFVFIIIGLPTGSFASVKRHLNSDISPKPLHYTAFY